MKRRIAVLALLSLSTLIISSIPARAAEFAPGTVELSISGTFDHQSLSESGGASATLTTASLAAGVGGFATSLFEVNAAFTVAHQSVDFGGFGGSSSATAFGMTGGVTLNFPAQGDLVPFIGAGAGFVAYSGDAYSGATTTAIAPFVRGGIRVMVGSSASVNFGVAYDHQTNALGVKDLDGNEFGLDVGISLYPNRRHETRTRRWHSGESE